MIEFKHLRQLKDAIDSIHPLGDACWAAVEPIVYCTSIAKKEFFSRDDEFAKVFGFVCKGIMRMFYLSENGEEYNKHFFLEGDFVAASIDLDRRSISNIQALAPTTLACISSPIFAELLNEFEEFNKFYQKLMLAYLEQKQQKEIQFLSNTAADNYDYFKRRYPGLEDKIPGYYVAGYLGITPTQLSRIRKRKRGFLNICK